MINKVYFKISFNREIFLFVPAGNIPEGKVRIHYLRPDQEYSGWGLHVWGEGFA
ncbi:MAG: pullulanase-associated domain-containing protein, partial [Bacillota bacterium]